MANTDKETSGRQTHGRNAFAGLTAAVVADHSDLHLSFVREIKRLHVDVRHIWPPPYTLPTDTDIIFCGVLPDLSARLPWPPGQACAALVIMLAPHECASVQQLQKYSPDGVIQLPATAAAVSACLAVSLDIYRYCRRLRHRVDRLDENLQAFRSIEDAKAILMKGKKVDADVAYGMMRKHAMKKRIPVATLAASIVDAGEIFD